MKTKLLYGAVFGMAALLLIGATTTEINLKDLPAATTVVNTTAVLVLTNATKARLATVQQILDLMNGQTNLSLNGYLSLSGESNQLTMAEGSLLLDGSPITGGGDTIWTNDGSRIYLPDYGSNAFFLHDSGAIARGESVVARWNPDQSDVIADVRDVSKGEPSIAYVNIEVLDDVSSVTNHSQFYMSIRQTSAQIEMQNQQGADTADFQVNTDPSDNYIGLTLNAQTLFSATTNGVKSDIGFVIGGTTNQITFGATNTAPSSTNVFTWISVQVSGMTNQFRLPVYQ